MTNVLESYTSYKNQLLIIHLKYIRSRINFLLELPFPSVDCQDRIGFVNHFSVFSLIRAFLEGNVILC